jgi:hypothetical protein
MAFTGDAEGDQMETGHFWISIRIKSPGCSRLLGDIARSDGQEGWAPGLAAGVYPADVGP